MICDERMRIGHYLAFSVLCILCYLYSIYFFSFGFMALTVSKSEISTFDNLSIEPGSSLNSNHNRTTNQENLYGRHFGRLVIVLIDALRADFALNSTAKPRFFGTTPFQYLKNLIQQRKAVAYYSRGHSPTVTLPKLKSLLTGSLSNFLDVIVNFDAGKLNEDNFMSQAYENKFKILHFGDDTWLKLLPDKFLRFDGTHSFFVSDYTEVDYNVTRHLEGELLKRDWDIMTLHYLGVDHIGHSFGPKSPLMVNKLKEMDLVVKKIYESLSNSPRNGLPDLIVICGDHGMTLGGNHGGNSEDETLTPLIFINTEEWGYFMNKYPNEVSQLDVAVTLSVLFGLPIPSNNMGAIIPEILHASSMSPRHVLYAASYNLHQLISVYKHKFGNKDSLLKSDSIREIISRHSQWLKMYAQKNSSKLSTDYLYILNVYMGQIYSIKQKLVQSSMGYDCTAMLLGLFLSWMSTAVFIALYVNFLNQSVLPIRKNYSTISTLVKIILCFKLITLMFFLMFQHFLYSICASTVFMIFFVLFFQCRIPCNDFIVLVNGSLVKNRVLIFLIFLPILSLTSSSFIEEEHQVWYLISTTILVSNFLHPLVLCQRKTSNPSEKQKLLVKCQSTNYETSHYSQCFSLLILLVTSRIFRSWNQTGNKWSHLPDISDWLKEHHDLRIVHIFVILCIVIIFHLLTKNNKKLTRGIVLCALIWVYLYKSQNEMIHSFILWLGYDKTNVFAPRIIYFHVVALVAVEILKNSPRFKHEQSTYKAMKMSGRIWTIVCCWSLLSLTLCSFENIAILLNVLLQEHILNKLTWLQNPSTFRNMLTYFVMAMCSFFNMGNSNSISSIDVFAGYTGMANYNPILVGFLIICNTYNGPVLWLLLAFYRIQTSNQSNQETRYNMKIRMLSCAFGLVSFRMMSLSVYVVLTYFLRHHLFIISVFSPKLLYEIMHTVMFVIVTSVIIFLSF